MEITGKIIAVLPERGGISKTGNEWKMQEYVLETHEQYPRKICFNVFGADKIAQFNIQAGDEMTVSFDINAREYNGRWYTDVRAWRIEPAAQAAPGPDYAASAGAYAAPTGAQGVPPITQEDPYAASAGAYSAPLEEDDLPF